MKSTGYPSSMSGRRPLIRQNNGPRLSHHFVNRPTLPLRGALVLFIIILAGPISAQQPQQQRGGAKEVKDKEAAAARREREQRAVTLLVETAERARNFDDLFYRARVQALAADALWTIEPERARQIFSRAWEAATLADKDEREADEAETGLPSEPNAEQFTEARREVLKRAAARDASLAEGFLKELRTASDDERDAAVNKSGSRPTPWRELSENGSRRLALAFELLNQGETEKAFQLAAPLVEEGTSADLVLFILQLQERDAARADALYRLLVERSRNDRRADVNSVLLMSAPVISPDLLVVLDERGSVQYRPVARRLRSSQTKGAQAPLVPALSSTAREAFYNFAAALLLRPRTTATGETGRKAESLALYFATGRLLPFFEREAAQYASELRARLASLGDEVEAQRRSLLSKQMETHELPTQKQGDPLGPETEQLARAHDAATRDAVLLKLAAKAARQRLWDRARRAAADIEDPHRRRAVQTFIVVSQIADITRTYTEDHETDLQSLTRFISNADAPSFARAWGWAQAALVAARLKKDRPTVAELLNNAEREADATDEGRGTRQRIAAYLVLTSAAAQVDQPRAWELLASAIKVVNATEDYAGDEDSLELVTGESLPGDGASDEVVERLSLDGGVFRLDEIFATMARLDFDRALTSARDLKGEVPQALASIAIARAALDQNRDGKR